VASKARHIGAPSLSFAPLVIAIFAAACTTTPGPMEQVEIRSEPVGATVTLRHGLSCTTPCKIVLPRISDFGETSAVARAAAPGCRDIFGVVVPLYGTESGGEFDMDDHYYLKPNPLLLRLDCGQRPRTSQSSK
jgi:hypothetical protein